jgi:hypothetical protein
LCFLRAASARLSAALSGDLPFAWRPATIAGKCGAIVLDPQRARRNLLRDLAIRVVSEMAKVRNPGEVKPGWTTSEFWQTVFVHLIAAVVALGTVFHANFNLNGLQAIVPAIALVASAVAQSVYSHSRATVKSSAQAAGAEVKLAGAASHRQVDGTEPAPIVVRVTGVQPLQPAAGNGERPAAGS